MGVGDPKLQGLSYEFHDGITIFPKKIVLLSNLLTQILIKTRTLCYDL